MPRSSRRVVAKLTDSNEPTSFGVTMEQMNDPAVVVLEPNATMPDCEWENDEAYPEREPIKEKGLFPQYSTPIRIALFLLILAVMDFLIAIIAGAELNKAICGSSSCTDYILAPAQSYLVDGTLNYMYAPCKTAAIALALSAIRFGVKVSAHRRLWGIFSFVLFTVLTGVIIFKCYANNEFSYTSATSPASAQLATQYRSLLGLPFDSILTSFESIAVAGDWYNWMRGPVTNLLRATLANGECHLSAMQAPQVGVNAPMQCAGNQSEVWKLHGCTLRQVRVIPETAPPRVFIPSVLPAFREDVLNKDTREWPWSFGMFPGNGSFFEAFQVNEHLTFSSPTMLADPGVTLV